MIARTVSPGLEVEQDHAPKGRTIRARSFSRDKNNLKEPGGR